MYDISERISLHSGMLLSHNGLEKDVTGAVTGKIQVCFSCHSTLAKSTKNPPKFAILNGFEIGHLLMSKRY